MFRMDAARVQCSDVKCIASCCHILPRNGESGHTYFGFYPFFARLFTLFGVVTVRLDISRSKGCVGDRAGDIPLPAELVLLLSVLHGYDQHRVLGADLLSSTENRSAGGSENLSKGSQRHSDYME